MDVRAMLQMAGELKYVSDTDSLHLIGHHRWQQWCRICATAQAAI